MWERIKRAFRSMANFFVSVAEDPELILEQNIRDLNAQVPKMNESIAMVRANVTLLEKEQARNRSEAAELTSKIKAAIQAQRDDLATSYAVQLEHVQKQVARGEGQLEAARAAYDKALNMKRVFMREKERRTREALDAIRAHKRAQWQARVAGVLEQMEFGALDQSHDDMIRRIEQKTAVAEARMELALESVDSGAMQIEEDAERIRAEALVQRIKGEMEGGERPRELEAGEATRAGAAPLRELRDLDEEKVGELERAARNADSK